MFATIWYLVKLVFCAVCALFLVKEFFTVHYMIKARQNKACDLMYFPILGIFGMHLLKSKKSEGKLSWILKRVSEHEKFGKKWIAVNSPLHLRPVYVLTDPQTISEFYLKEMDIAARKNPQPEPALLELGIFYKFDDRAMKVRGAFTEIFRIENVTKVTPIVSDLV